MRGIRLATCRLTSIAYEGVDTAFWRIHTRIVTWKSGVNRGVLYILTLDFISPYLHRHPSDFSCSSFWNLPGACSFHFWIERKEQAAPVDFYFFLSFSGSCSFEQTPPSESERSNREFFVVWDFSTVTVAQDSFSCDKNKQALQLQTKESSSRTE